MSVPPDQMESELNYTQEQAAYAPEYDPEGEEEEVNEENHPLLAYLDEGNLVDKLDNRALDSTNSGVTQKIMQLHDEAAESMGKWKKKYKKALNLAKLQAMSGEQEIDSKSFPFEGASLVMLPYILEAMLDFNSRAAPDLVWSKDIVKAKVYGEKTQEKEDRAKRVADFSNYQLSELIPEWRNDQDKGLMVLSAVGTFYKEIYFDQNAQEICSELCLADEVIFNHDYRTFNAAPDKFRKCTYTKNDVIGFIRGEQKWDIEESDLPETDESFDFIKAYTWIDLDGNGLKQPYIAFIWEEKNKVVCLYPAFDEDTLTISEDGELIKIEAVDRFIQYRFLPDPEGGPMGMGWGILLGPMFDSINTSVRQLIDAGTISNTSSNSGLITQGLSGGRGNAAQSGPIEIALGQLTPVPFTGNGTLRDNIVQLPFAGPSPVLFQLLDYLVGSARSMTNAAVNIEANAGEAASLYLAKLQQGLKVPNSIIMRVYECAKSEFKLFAKLNYNHFDDNKYNRVLDTETPFSMEKDFDPEDCDIAMTADPSQGSDIERVQRAQAVYQMAKDPQQPSQVIDYRKSVIAVLEAMGGTDVEEMVPEPDPNAKDPMQELMIAQAMAEIEINQKATQLRADELELKKMKLAMESARTMSSLGLQADKQEAEITNLYSQALERIVKSGIADAQTAMQSLQNIESNFIGDNDDARDGIEIPAAIQGSGRDMAIQSGNEGLPSMPPMGGVPIDRGNG